ncbi:tyrosyl-tRNA synthetase [Azospirillum thiophilum]|uniref:Tyrosine--tRNA ligase n=1 Tax=Azospirillum thiophilum TaxID=528244 RepID=A0AAC9EWY5_9PROT|nr:tyrosine--tRNA ligase [Azospirillum thiophilum]ALG69892.1 tyrosyl-tRNA synthetase [Azospirillum thiophilum]KJR66422.1 tyrosyl-tRNA synthetase [Azospirillum thiophilum]
MPTRSSAAEFLRILRERGFLHQCSDPAGDLSGLAAAAPGGTLTAYVGFDATAGSLHVGHLLSIMALRWLQRTGNRPIVLIGGGTTRIGDPSFRDTSRPMLDDARIAANAAGLRGVFGQYLTFGDGPADAVMVDNADWLDGLDYVPFLRDVGRHFTINRMLSFESVRQRMEREQPLTFLEFNYMILQAYDFLELARRHGCLLQMGGSDQWGNIVNGIELARRAERRELFGLTTPLLATASGTKMGKTAGGAVWLNADARSPFDFWQFWRNTEDADVGRFLRLFTELPLDEIARLERLQGAEINEAKILLATEATRLCHGGAEAERAAAAAGAPLAAGGDGLPEITLQRGAGTAGVPLVDALVASGLSASKGAARRLIREGGARLDGESVTDEAAVLTGPAVLSAGRKRHVRLILAP